MGKIILIVLMTFTFVFNVSANTVNYNNGEKYSGEILFQNIGALYVDNGVLDLNGINIPNGTKIFIPFTKKSFTYLGEFNDGKGIILPTNDVRTQDFALYNVEVSLPGKNYEVFFNNSNTSEQIKHSLVVPYLYKKGAGHMIIRELDNFIVIDFTIPENAKTVVKLDISESIQAITANFNLNIYNEYVQLEKPEILLTKTGFTVTDKVSGFSEIIEVNRNMFASYYYQNIVYDLNLDTNKITQGASSMSDKKDIFNNYFNNINIKLSSTFVLSDISSKIQEKNNLLDLSNKAIKKTKEGDKGALHYGIYIMFALFIIGLCWYFDDKISLVLFKTGKFTDDLVENNIRKPFLGIIVYTNDDSFIEIILKLKKLPSNKLNIESVDLIIDNLKGISKRISDNLKLKGELLSKKDLIETKLSEAEKLANDKTLEVRFSTVDFAYTIESCKATITLLENKLSTIDSMNHKYAEKFQQFTTHLSKYLFDAEMDKISDSIDFDEILVDNVDDSAIGDLFNLEKLTKSLTGLNDYDEALSKVISDEDKQQILKTSNEV